MESQPQNPEFRMNPENFHPCEPCSAIGSKSNCRSRGCEFDHSLVRYFSGD